MDNFPGHAEQIDEEAISKIIPTLFTEMTDSFSRTRPSLGADAARHDRATLSLGGSSYDDENEYVRALVQESEQLDAVIAVVAGLDATLQQKVSRDLLKTRATCRSTIRILNSWNSIFSQAGYLGTLCENANRNSPSTGAQRGARKTNAQILEAKTTELDDLKSQLAAARKTAQGTTPGKRGSPNQSQHRGSAFKKPSVPGIRKPAPGGILKKTTQTQPTRSGTSGNGRPWLPQPKKRNLFSR